MQIETILSRQILDSRGRPTVETTVILDAGVSATAAVPSGASTGSHEAVELRDDDPEHFGGLGVLRAVANVTGPIAKALKGQDARHQRAIDELLLSIDGTVNKSKLGANAILSVSMAVARAGAALQRLPLYRWIQQVYDLPGISADRLPIPMMNILNGGRHADTELPIQEFLILPHGETPLAQLERGTAVYRELAKLLTAKHLRTTVGDEGGFAPAIKDPSVALDFITKAIVNAGGEPGRDVELGLDVAASELFDPARQRYRLGSTRGGLVTAGMISVLKEWVATYRLKTIEDPLAEDDWAGWTEITAALGQDVKIIGDDLFVTNASRLQRGIDQRAANGVLVKPNQVGTLTETIETVTTAQAAGYIPVVSHRSGETGDTFIADLAVAVGAPYLKAGAPARGERVVKYNRLLQIASELTA